VSAAGYLTLFLFLLLLPLNVYSAELFHTIQTNSFSSVHDAQKQFDSIVNKLDETQLDNLRIEKIGKFYTVRLGKFFDKASAEGFYGTVKPKLPDATVMSAYIKKERLVRLYSGSASENSKKPEDRLTSDPVPDKFKSKTTKKEDEKVSSEPLKKDLEKSEGVNKKTAESKTSSLQIGGKIKPQLSGKVAKKEKGVPLKEKIKNIEALVRKNDYAAALDIIKAEIREQPEHPELNAWFGMVLLKMEKPLNALEYLGKAAELSPNEPDYHNALGYSFFFLNRYDDAIEEFNKAISLDPGHFDAFTGLCIAYIKNDNKEKAMDIYHKIKFIDKKTAKQLLTLINK